MNKKALFFSIVVGVILISIMLSIQNLFPSDETRLTGTPADNFSEENRSKFCGTGVAKSNNYIKEYKIPTDCTLPQAIITDP
ncbi:MAG: lyase, partial [Nitrosopumilus sp.]